MTVEMFDWLVEKVSPHIHRQDTNMRKSISVSERLSITLRHLATGMLPKNYVLPCPVEPSHNFIFDFSLAHTLFSHLKVKLKNRWP